MCTLAIYLQVLQDYPLIVAANRDESLTRPSSAPRVLSENPLVFGGQDLLAGGTWLGVNEYGLLAGIVNRRVETQEHWSAVRSRGLLCLDILRAKDPLEALSLLRRPGASLYRPFNLLFADADQAYVAYNKEGVISWLRLAKGLHVLGNTTIYSAATDKMEHAYLLFSRLKDALEKEGDRRARIRTLKAVLSDHTLRTDSSDPKDAICVHGAQYGTVSSTIVLYGGVEKRFYYYHAAESPCRSDYREFPSLEVR